MKKKKIVSRRQIREKVLQILYAHHMTKDPVEPTIKEQLADVKDKDTENFARKIIKHTLEEDERYDKLIKETVEHWDMERIAILDSIVIKMCLTEFFHFPDIPAKVSINESIDIAKTFSTKNSGKFVNGVIDALQAKLMKDGSISKIGKGLITGTKQPNAKAEKSPVKKQTKTRKTKAKVESGKDE